uniref:Galactose-1-phosphate uridyl transferase N-terminal domain-containing protein n=1 Tax=Malus domestica TaxID=3750 RepID=W0UTL9_MALDO|nr:hypothetical protein [Malus domestica]
MASDSAARTPQLRKDSVTKRWVIFSPARARRPSNFKSKSPINPNSDQQQQCPFCISHEHECAPEIFRLLPDNADWTIRVIQNLYPALSRDMEVVSAQDPLHQNSDWVMGDGGRRGRVGTATLAQMRIPYLPRHHLMVYLTDFPTEI